MSNNIQELREIAIDMAEGMNIIAENYNDLISIEKKVINLQKDINDIRSKSYMSQNLLEKCFERLGEMIMRTEDVSSVSSETKNINKVGLDMPPHSGKIQVTTNVDNIRDMLVKRQKYLKMYSGNAYPSKRSKTRWPVDQPSTHGKLVDVG